MDEFEGESEDGPRGGASCPLCHRALRALENGKWYCDECEVTFES